MMDGISEGWGGHEFSLSPAMKRVLMRSVGPQRLTYQKKLGWDTVIDENGKSRRVRKVVEQQVVSVRGVLMGTPLAWPLLCLTHMWLIDTLDGLYDITDSWKQIKLVGQRPENLLTFGGDQGLRLAPTPAVCGDDLLALRPQVWVDDYNRKMVSIGGKLSKGKHIMSKVGCVFTEEIWLRSTKGSWYRPEYSHLRGVVRALDHIELQSKHGMNTTMPSWLILGPSLSACLNRAHAGRMTARMFPGLAESFEGYGIHP